MTVNAFASDSTVGRPGLPFAGTFPILRVDREANFFPIFFSVLLTLATPCRELDGQLDYILVDTFARYAKDIVEIMMQLRASYTLSIARWRIVAESVPNDAY